MGSARAKPRSLNHSPAEETTDLSLAGQTGPRNHAVRSYAKITLNAYPERERSRKAFEAGEATISSYAFLDSIRILAYSPSSARLSGNRWRRALSYPSLAQIRIAHVERCQAACTRIQHRRGAEPEGLPDTLVDAGCWLVANGWDGEPSAAEIALGWGPARYRAFLDGAAPAVARHCIEHGRKALFEGRHAIFPSAAPARAA
jgi:hypothetical protein